MKQIEVELQDVFGEDRTIANAAWTSSTDKLRYEQRSTEDVERVINMLADSGHASCFEAVVLRYWIKVPIAIDRQLMTHRWMSSNGLSGRYRQVPSEFLEVPDDIWKVVGKLMAVMDPETNDFISARQFYEGYSLACEQANAWYEDLILLAKASKESDLITNDEYKRIREFSRGVLPQHNMTERVLTINLRSLCNFFRLRLDKAAQPEIQDVARQMYQELQDSKRVPAAIAALERNKFQI